MKLPFDFTRFKLLPKLIVVDLDHTLWPLGIDQFVYKPPYHRRYANLLHVSKNAPSLQSLSAEQKESRNLFKVFDSEQKEMKPFPEVPEVLSVITQQLKIPLAAASRTEYPAGANSLIDLFDWQQYFKHRQIYPGSKTAHFQQFKQLTSTLYDQMLFFDDENRNIVDVSQLGVTCILVDPQIGLNLKCLHDGLLQFEQNQK